MPVTPTPVPDEESDYSWLKTFDREDLEKFCIELMGAVDNAHSVIHEWRESAWVAQSGILHEALNLPSDEILLPNPSELELRP
jgi:hypothetical protein